jgi:hypothetical protein
VAQQHHVAGIDAEWGHAVLPLSPDEDEQVPLRGVSPRAPWWLRGGPVAVTGFTVRCGRSVELDVLADPSRLRRLDLAVLDG